jgi:hypothetical protein
MARRDAIRWQNQHEPMNWNHECPPCLPCCGETGEFDQGSSETLCFAVGAQPHPSADSKRGSGVGCWPPCCGRSARFEPQRGWPAHRGSAGTSSGIRGWPGRPQRGRSGIACTASWRPANSSVAGPPAARSRYQRPLVPRTERTKTSSSATPTQITTAFLGCFSVRIATSCKWRNRAGCPHRNSPWPGLLERCRPAAPGAVAWP